MNYAPALQRMAKEPYENKGILHSEAAYIIYHCRKHGVEQIIESGRARGQSAYMFAKYMPDVEVHSVELRDHPVDDNFALTRLGPFKNVACYKGDGAQLLPYIAHLYPKKTAVFCDGPKGEAAVKVLRECFSLPNVVIGFIHDMRRLDHGGPSPHRDCAILHLPFHEFSDEPSFVAALSWMDADIEASGGPCGPRFDEVHGSYGPTVGAFLNPTAISNQ